VLGNDSHYFNLFVFFDAAGRYNFLRGEFGDGADDARKWVRENIPELAELENDVRMSELVAMVAQYPDPEIIALQKYRAAARGEPAGR
jgi:hypothetical protein